MIHQEHLQELEGRFYRDGFFRPAYGYSAITEIPFTIMAALGLKPARAALPFPLAGQNYKKVVFFLLDGLGFNHLVGLGSRVSFFQKLSRQAEVYPVTSVFPSTTAAALTSLHSGLSPQEHGLPEWVVYFEELQSVIETLPFRLLGTDEANTMLARGGNPAMLYNGPTIYEMLSQQGVASYNFIYHEYASGAYQKAVNSGSHTVTFANGVDLMEKLKQQLATDERAYYFVYWSPIDSVQHAFGPGSAEHLAELEVFSELMEGHFLSSITSRHAKDALLLLSADHGQAAISENEISYLNDFPELEKSYQLMMDGKTIPPTGSPHNVFLSIQPGKLEKTLGFLKQTLERKARVLKIDEALELGLFGLNQPAPKFLRRVGNALILPFAGQHVWYRHLPGQTLRFKGIHGGLSREEMLVPFAICELEKLLE